MTDTAHDIEFEQTLTGWVRAASARGVRSFPDLVAALPGAYPADIARVVARLKDELPFAWSDGHTPAPQRTSTSAGWPVEHPLDFDWRFTPEASQLLLDRCPTGLPAAFLGAPSLAREAAELGRRGAVRLFDRNPSVVAAARKACPGIAVTHVDLLWDAPVDPSNVAVSVADPPWYPEHTAAFLWTAARLTRVGGMVLLSLPPEGTRPGILAEREAMLAVAASFGLKLVSLETGVLAYQMPLFERNALAAAGVTTASADWRRGDLASFTVLERIGVPRPPAPGEPDDWDEESVGSVRIKCRKCPVGEFRDPTLSQLVSGDMLTSVSRRHPTRAAVDVWTSGNRIFRCLSPSLFRVILSSLACGSDAEDAVSLMLARRLTPEESALVRRATTQAADLVQREEWELTKYGHRCHERDLVEAV